jgi:hypothetical protein
MKTKRQIKYKAKSKLSASVEFDYWQNKKIPPRIVSHEAECADEHERSTYRFCVAMGEPVACGCLIAKPIKR